MKTTKLESKKTLKDQPRRVAGVKVRSGVKAGRRLGGERHVGEPGRLG